MEYEPVQPWRMSQFLRNICTWNEFSVAQGPLHIHRLQSRLPPPHFAFILKNIEDNQL